MRLFIAFHLPDHIRQIFARYREQHNRNLPTLRWVRSEGIHLTLKFLGEVDEGDLTGIREALDAVVPGSAASELQLRGLGVFPNPRRPRVLWVGLAEVPEALTTLQQAVEQVMEGEGFPREQRVFRPHFTLGRFRGMLRGGEGRRLTDILERHRDDEPGAFAADRLVLYQSFLQAGGASYQALAEWNLEKG